jgi:hypothetical protein
MPLCLPVGQNSTQVTQFNSENPFLNVLKNGSLWFVTGAKSASGITISNASPAVIGWAGHGLSAGACFVLSTTGTLPNESTTGSPLRQGTAYYVLSTGLLTNSFEFSTTPGGTAIITTSAGSGTHTADCNVIDNMNMDSNGYPTSMTLLNGSGTATKFQLFSLRSFPSLNAPTPYEAGTYVLQYSGAGTVSNDATASSDFSFVEHGGIGRDIYYVATPTAGGICLQITATPITNLSFVYSPGSYGATGQGGGGQTGPVNGVGTNEANLNAVNYTTGNGVFTDAFLNKTKSYQCFRFMGWQNTLYDANQNWSTRATTPYYIWGNQPSSNMIAGKTNVGVPLEVCIALCNKLNINGWMQVPFCAGGSTGQSITYVSNMASLIKSNLNTNLKMYIEFGNEYWNNGNIYPGSPDFLHGTVYAADPYEYVYAKGTALFPSVPGGDQEGTIRDYGIYMVTLIGDTFHSTFTGGDAARVVILLSGQHGNTGPNTSMMAMTMPHDGATNLWTGTAGSHADGLCTAPYFGPLSLGYDVPEAWSDTTTFPDPAANVFAEINSGLIPSSHSGALVAGGTGSAYTVTTGHGYTSGTIPNGTMLVIDFNVANNSAGATLAIDSVGALNLTDTYASNIGANLLGPTGTCRYAAVCYTSKVGVGGTPVSPAQCRLAGYAGDVSVTGMYGGWPGGYLQNAYDWWTNDYNAAVAAGLQFVGYESGQSFLGSPGQNWDTLYTSVNLDSRMSGSYENYYQRLLQINGNKTINHLGDIVSSPGRYWGALYNVLDIGSPKFNALVDLSSCPVVTSQSPGPRSRRVVHYHHVAGT